MPLDSDPPVSLTRAEIARLEAEARAVLREVEPVHAANERAANRKEREQGYVLFAITGTGRERGSCLIERESDWRPRATRTPSGWSIEGGWLDEAVPELPTGLTRSKSTLRLFIRDGAPALRLRGGKRLAETWRSRRDAMRMWPMPITSPKGFPDEAIGRGWCSGLAAAAPQVYELGTAAGWRAMQRAHDRMIAETDAAWTAERAAIVRAKGEG